MSEQGWPEVKNSEALQDAVRRGALVIVSTPTGQLTMLRRVAEELIKHGVISGDIESGRLHAGDAATVKAAMISKVGTCDFCAAPGALKIYTIPHFDLMPGVRSTDWLACDTCDDLIQRARKSDLLERTIQTHAFGKFAKPQIAQLHAQFWKAMGDKADAAGFSAALIDYVEGRLHAMVRQPVLRDRDERHRRVMDLTGLTPRQMEDLLEGKPDSDALSKILKVWKGAKTDSLGDIIGDPNRKPMTPVIPHWQAALDSKFEAMVRVEQLAESGVPAHLSQDNDLDMSDREAVDLAIQRVSVASKLYRDQLKAEAEALRYAETYSFNGETADAIMAASDSMLVETRLSAIDTPGNGRAGWFWFAEPLPVATVRDEQVTHALLWFWRDDRRRTEGAQPELCISAYSYNDASHKDGSHLQQGAYWHWERSQTMKELFDDVRKTYDDGEVIIASDDAYGIEEMARGVETLTKFFVAACQWVKQKIAVASPGHVERHARKRVMREHKLKEPPTVQVIALRKSVRDAAKREPVDGQEPGVGHKIRVRFVVQGHWRFQRCGPGLKDEKLIWIMPFIKGPDDGPLRKKERVYAVIR